MASGRSQSPNTTPPRPKTWCRFYFCAQGGESRALPCHGMRLLRVSGDRVLLRRKSHHPGRAFRRLPQPDFLSRPRMVRATRTSFRPSNGGCRSHYFCGYHMSPYAFQQTSHVDTSAVTLARMTCNATHSAADWRTCRREILWSTTSAAAPACLSSIAATCGETPARPRPAAVGRATLLGGGKELLRVHSQLLSGSAEIGHYSTQG